MARDDESHTNPAHSQIAMRDAVPLARGTVLAERYEVETTLGRGGAGVVLRAHDRELREAVAIKILHPELSQQTRWIERLAREVKLARQLRHPNVCRVFDFERADGYVFIVMELATGGSLRHELHDQAHVARSPEARLVDARAVADGLAAIHQAGIAHRDVTPQNVLRMADGRLVVSDFGLATEISQTTASVHGGTIAYMAPEVVRGQRADFAADVWSLGVVIHEIMFGGRPTWSKGGAMLSPLAGRTLAKSEHLVYDICRACTAARPGDRPASAGEVVAWLGGRRQTPRHPARRWISLALVAAVALVGASRLGTRSSIGATDQLEPTGEPVDWSETATVLATVQGRVECLVSLPGREAVRFAWGKPKQVEDLELDTGRRGPAPLVPEAQKEGCAQPSPDGKHLVYQGYAPDGRAFAFVSDRPDGSGALPVVPIADPSLRSDPVWLSNSKELVIDIDPQHAGVFSLETRRTRVLRDVTSGPPLSVFRSVVGSTIAVLASTEQPLVTDVVGFAWPSGTEATRFRVPGAVFELASLDGRTFFTSHIQDRGDYELWRADLPAHSLKRVAMVRDQDVRSLGLTKDRLVFVTRRDVSDAWRRSPEGRLEPLTRDAQIMEITRCGSGFMAVTRNFSLIRLDREGRSPREVARGQQLRTVACAPDGATWYPIQWGNASNVARCDTSGCVPLVEGELWSVAVSPSGERLAFVRTSAGGLRVETMSVRGGEARAVTLADALCPIGWSSDHALWVPRRVDAKLTWTEVDVKSGAATGKTKVGAHDCTDGWADPESPVQSDLRIVTRSISQIRSVPLRMLGL